MNCLGIVLSSFAASFASHSALAEIAPSTDNSGASLVTRLFEGSGLATSAVHANTTHFVGQTTGGSQSGLLDGLTLSGANGTSQTMGAGIVLTSGLVNALPSSNTTGSYSNVTSTGGNNYFRDFPATTGQTRHSGRLQEHDENSLTFDIDVPAGVVGVRVEFVYASEEFPEWSGTAYADGFAFIVDDVNYARLPDGRPVSLLAEGDNVHFMFNGDSFDPSVPMVVPMEYDGITRVLELTAPLRPGHRQTVTLVVADTGDEIYDSAVFVRSFQFITGEAPIDPGPVHTRHNSPDDDSFVEHGENCDSIDFNRDASFFDPTDIDAYLSVFSEGPCVPEAANCADLDFNNDNSVFDPCDITSFLTVYAEGPCTPCGQ